MKRGREGDASGVMSAPKKVLEEIFFHKEDQNLCKFQEDQEDQNLCKFYRISTNRHVIHPVPITKHMSVPTHTK